MKIYFRILTFCLIYSIFHWFYEEFIFNHRFEAGFDLLFCSIMGCQLGFISSLPLILGLTAFYFKTMPTIPNSKGYFKLVICAVLAYFVETSSSGMTSYTNAILLDRIEGSFKAVGSVTTLFLALTFLSSLMLRIFNRYKNWLLKDS